MVRLRARGRSTFWWPQSRITKPPAFPQRGTPFPEQILEAQLGMQLFPVRVRPKEMQPGIAFFMGFLQPLHCPIILAGMRMKQGY